MDMQASMGIVIFLILATLCFEYGREGLEENFEKYSLVLSRIWSELTVLGFLALVTFILLQGGVLQATSEAIFGDHVRA